MPQFVRLLLLAGFFVGIAGCRPASDRVRIYIWHQKTGPERAFFERVVGEYNAANPARDVEPLYRETEELRNLFVISSVGGQGPDLVFGPADNVSILALTESIRPITDVLPTDYLDQFADDGIIYWKDAPWMVADQIGNHLMFVYNKRFLPEPPETISEMIQMLGALVRPEEGAPKVDYGLTWNSTEPYFFVPFLTGYGGWVMTDDGRPTLDTEATVKAVQLILDLGNKHGLTPGAVDYDTADALFKEQRAAAIINGPWSWAGYEKAGVDYGLARIPLLDETGLWCAPIVSAKGYSVNVNLPEEKIPHVRHLLEYLTDARMQRAMALELATIPVIDSLRSSESLLTNNLLQASIRQVEVGKLMPSMPQLRQIWDGMRGPYQLIMNGKVSAEEGARLMQAEVEKRIADTFL